MKRRLLLSGFLVIIFVYNLRADISYSPLQPVVNQQVVFTVSNPDGISESRAQWDFGDGTPVSWNSITVSHQYSNAGTYVVKAIYWTNLGVNTTDQITITVSEEQGFGPDAAFQISFLQLRFEDGKAYKLIHQNFRPLKACADIKYEGTGIFIGQWLVDGMPIHSVSQPLYYARSLSITSAELPTLVPGRHEVSLKILSPSTEFETPTIIYFVERKKEIIVPMEPETPVKVPEFHHLAGTVIYGNSRKPVPNVTVEFREYDYDTRQVSSKGKVYNTDSQGRFMFVNVPSYIFYTLEIYSQSHLFKGQNRDFEYYYIADKNVDNLIVEVEPLLKKVKGRIINGLTNKPEKDLNIFIMKPILNTLFPGEMSDMLYIKKTDSEGDFFFKNVRDGIYSIFIHNWRFGTKAVKTFTLEEGERIKDLGTIEVDPLTGTLKVKVMLPNGKQPILKGTEKISVYPSDYNISESLEPRDKPLYLKEVDKNKGKCSFKDIPITNIKEWLSGAYNLYFSDSKLYENGWNKAFVLPNEAFETEFLLSKRRPKILGKVIDTSSTPILNAKVELLKRTYAGHETYPYGTAYTNKQGEFVFMYPDALNKDWKHDIKVSAEGYFYRMLKEEIDFTSHYREKDTDLGEITLVLMPGKDIEGCVYEMINSKKNPIGGVTITTSASSVENNMTRSEGDFIFPDVRCPEITLHFSKEGYNDSKIKLELKEYKNKLRWFKKGEPIPKGKIEIIMSPQTGSLGLTVKAKSTFYDSNLNQHLVPIKLKNARVTIKQNEERLAFGETDENGKLVFDCLPVGKLTASITGPEKSNYVSKTTLITIEKDKITIIEIELEQGSELSGWVTWRNRIGRTVPFAEVEIEGSEIKSKPKKDGSFIFLGVPPGNHTLKAWAKGAISACKEINNLNEGEKRAGIIIKLASSPVNKLFGFDVIIEDIRELKDGTKKITGWLDTISQNAPVKIEKNLKVRFEDLHIDSDFEPLADSAELSASEIKVKVYGYEGYFKSSSGNLKVGWKDKTQRIGEIKGYVDFLNSKNFSSIPATSWTDERTEELLITSQVSSSGRDELVLSFDKIYDNLEMWGFDISITKARINSLGFHYDGILKIPDMHEFNFKDLNIYSNQNKYKMNSEGAKILHRGPIIIKGDKSIKIKITNATWKESSIYAKGTFELVNLCELSFEELIISYEGAFLGVEINYKNSNFKVYGCNFYIDNAEFHTDPQKKMYFEFKGTLDLENFNNNIVLSNLEFWENGILSNASLKRDQTLEFADIVGVSLKSLELKNKDKEILLKGNINFRIPGLNSQEGKFHFSQKRFSLDEINFGFDAGPADVSAVASWNDKQFEGDAKINVPSAFSADAIFHYGGQDDFSFSLKSDVDIPIEPIVITEVRGGLARSKGNWEFDLGGTGTLFAKTLEYALSADLNLKVKSGPIISGSADLSLFTKLNFSNADITFDLKRGRFSGNVKVRINKYGLNFNQNLGFEASKNYWYFGGNINTNFLNILNVNNGFYIGYNYPNPKPSSIRKINGIFIHAYCSRKLNIHLVDAKLKIYADAMINPYNNDYEGKISLNGNISADFRFIGAGGYLNTDGDLEYSNGWNFNLSTALKLKGWSWPCNKNSSCGRWCKICPSLTFKATYSKTKGWDFNLF